MQAYQLTFHGPDGATIGRSDFFARDDGHALAMATVAYKACSDLAASYAVRQGVRTLVGRAAAECTAITWSELAMCRQDAAVKLEEQIQQSGWAVARSRRLLHQLDYFRVSATLSAGTGPGPEDPIN